MDLGLASSKTFGDIEKELNLTVLSLWSKVRYFCIFPIILKEEFWE